MAVACHDEGAVAAQVECDLQPGCMWVAAHDRLHQEARCDETLGVLQAPAEVFGGIPDDKQVADPVARHVLQQVVPLRLRFRVTTAGVHFVRHHADPVTHCVRHQEYCMHVAGGYSLFEALGVLPQHGGQWAVLQGARYEW